MLWLRRGNLDLPQLCDLLCVTLSLLTCSVPPLQNCSTQWALSKWQLSPWWTWLPAAELVVTEWTGLVFPRPLLHVFLVKHKCAEGPLFSWPGLPGIADKDEVGGIAVLANILRQINSCQLRAQWVSKLECFLGGDTEQMCIHALSSMLGTQPFIIMFLNKAGQWQCKHYLNKSIWLLEIKPKGK